MAAGGIKRGTDSHASDVGHWLGMTGKDKAQVW